MQRHLRFLVAISLTVAAGGCSHDSSSPFAPNEGVAPDSLGSLVYSGPADYLLTPAWSGRTDRIYFVEPRTGMLELDPASGAVRALAEDANHLVMAPNGRALYYLGRAWQLDRFDLETQQHTLVADSVIALPVPSNGDLLVAYTHWIDALVVATPSGSSVEPVASLGFPFAFSPDDREILYATHPSLQSLLNKDMLHIRNLDTGLVRVIPSNVPGIPFGGPYWGAQGITIAFTEEYKRLWVRIGDADRMIFSSPESIDPGSMSWSPGGTRLAFLTIGHHSRGYTLTAWVVDLETSRVFRVAHGFDRPDATPGPPDEMPTVWPGNATTFSPDGRSLAFTSTGRIFIAPID